MPACWPAIRAECPLIMIETLPPIEDLLPHRGTMLLLDRVTEFDDGVAAAEYSPRAGAWYAGGDGNMPGWFGIELMAQAVAAHVALVRRRAGLPVRPGVLLGTRGYRCGVASFAAGCVLVIRAREIFRDESGLAGYECRITQEAAVLAEATLKVYEPENFERFRLGQRQ
jgi:predicted hotdog family 3-hydroxylacyl-ACP dehydratase